MTEQPRRAVRSRPGHGAAVPPGAVRRLAVAEAIRLALPHAVVVLLDGAWRHAWLLGHHRDAETTSFLVQRLDPGATEPVWISDAELGEVDPRHGEATA